MLSISLYTHDDISFNKERKDCELYIIDINLLFRDQQDAIEILLHKHDVTFQKDKEL